MFKVVTYYDNLTLISVTLHNGHVAGENKVPNIPMIKQLIENDLRKQIELNNHKYKLSCFITIKYDNPNPKQLKGKALILLKAYYKQAKHIMK